MFGGPAILKRSALRVVTAAGLLTLAACQESHNQSHTKAIYGRDDRIEVYEAAKNDALMHDVQGTALLLYRGELSPSTDPNFLNLREATAASRLGLCPSERFSEEPSVGDCSGFLVAPKVLATAGHCFEDNDSCSKRAIAFGFDRNPKDRDLSRVSVSDVYYCKRVIHEEDPGLGGIGPDFALIELDRPVANRQPLAYRFSARVPDHAPLLAVGHPLGLPTKIAAGANVRDNAEKYTFTANLDTFGGSSGSPVINASTGLVEGILISGETDFVDKNGCKVAKICPDNGCTGESATRATVFAPYLSTTP